MLWLISLASLCTLNYHISAVTHVLVSRGLIWNAMSDETRNTAQSVVHLFLFLSFIMAAQVLYCLPNRWPKEKHMLSPLRETVPVQSRSSFVRRLIVLFGLRVAAQTRIKTRGPHAHLYVYCCCWLSPHHESVAFKVMEKSLLNATLTHFGTCGVCVCMSAAVRVRPWQNTRLVRRVSRFVWLKRLFYLPTAPLLS